MATIFLEYFYWHYVIAPVEILKIMSNYIGAARHQFLMTQHLRTLFASWHRQNPSDFGRKNPTFVYRILDVLVSLCIRLLAACIRSAIIILGLVWQFTLLIFFIFIFVVWVSWPVISILSISKGINLIYGF